MREWNQYCLIDIFSKVDPSCLEENFLEGDLDLFDLESSNLWPEKEKKWNKKKIVWVTGIAAGTVAVAGALLFLCHQNQKIGKAA